MTQIQTNMQNEITLTVHQLEKFSEYDMKSIDYMLEDRAYDNVLSKFKGWTFSSRIGEGKYDKNRHAYIDYTLELMSPSGSVYTGIGGRFENFHIWETPITFQLWVPPMKEPDLKERLINELNRMSSDDYMDEAQRYGYNEAIDRIRYFITNE